CPLSMQLEDVVREGNQSKLILHVGKASQKKATQTSHAFDLTEHRFHDRLAHSVKRRRDRGAQLVAHPISASTHARVACGAGRDRRASACPAAPAAPCLSS